jgi:hypothetical protein
MSADAVHNLTPTDSAVPLAPAPRHFPTPSRQKLKSAERTRETLARTESASIAKSTAYTSFNRELQAKIPFKHVTKTPHKKRQICAKNAPFTPAKLGPALPARPLVGLILRPHPTLPLCPPM